MDSLTPLDCLARSKKVMDMVPVYVDLIQGIHPPDYVVALNQAIMDRWSKNALMRIKTQAWKIVEANRGPGTKRLTVTESRKPKEPTHEAE